MLDDDSSHEIDPTRGARAASALGQADLARRRVLVVDDDPALLRTTARVLRPSHDVTTARSASDGMCLLEAGFRFDTILCDVWMPGTDGSVFLRDVEARVPTQASRIVFVTGGGLPYRLEKFLVGRSVVRKPWRRDDLLRAIEALGVDREPMSRPPRPSRDVAA